MTRRAFQIWIAILASLYGLFILTGIKLYGSGNYNLFKDLLPVSTALPAAILVGVYQRRSSFLVQLRATWVALVDAVQVTIQFTHLERPDAAEFSKVMVKLSIVIDDFRSLYRNLKEDNLSIGYFPFESLKDIQKEISKYYFNKDFSEAQRRDVRNTIVALWKKVRSPILEEFDRLEPKYFDTPFLRNGIERRVSPSDGPRSHGREA